MENLTTGDRILSVDIGGSNIKATLLNQDGQLMMDYKKIETPVPATPEKVINGIMSLAKNFENYNKVSVGFPGYVKEGIIHTAPNLDTNLWSQVNLREQLTSALNKPVVVVNDADMLGMGVVSGKGFEVVITLGTGFGTAFVNNGILLPHLELAHHPVSKDQTYDEYVGEKALDNKGLEKWNERMRKVLAILKTVFNYDCLYIGGGNAKKLTIILDANMRIFSNKDGIKGGVRLWQMDKLQHEPVAG
ncbi:MAG: ROK family protein [Chitinophagaceae bacterium]